MEKTAQSAAAPTAVTKKNFLDIFIGGGKKGLNLWFNSMMPSIVVSGLLVAIINETGLIDLVGRILGPVMGIFGLPGEAAVIWVGSFMNMAFGILSSLPMIEAGTLTMEHVTILLPMIMLQVPPAKLIRMAGASGAEGKDLKICFGLMILSSALGGILMRVLLIFL